MVAGADSHTAQQGRTEIPFAAARCSLLGLKVQRIGHPRRGGNRLGPV